MARTAWNKGAKLSDEHRAAISRANRLIEWTPEMKAAVRAFQTRGVGFERMSAAIGVSGMTIWAANRRGVFA